MTRMLIIGPPGSGKGTQSAAISKALGIVAISTGDIFRENVKGKTALGVEAQKYINAGDLVPDSLTNRLVRDRLNEADVNDGFLLDGYPRSTTQVDYLDSVLTDAGQKLNFVLELTCDEQELVARLLGRAKEAGRSDDNQSVIAHRLDLYHEQTEPVIAKYKERGIVTRIDGMGPMVSVTGRVLGAIRTKQSAPSRNETHSASSLESVRVERMTARFTQ